MQSSHKLRSNASLENGSLVPKIISCISCQKLTTSHPHQQSKIWRGYPGSSRSGLRGEKVKRTEQKSHRMQILDMLCRIPNYEKYRDLLQ